VKSLRILAIDDEQLALDRIELALRSTPHVTVVGTARSGREGLEMIRELRPDVILLDVNMPEFDGFDMLETLAPPEVPLVIFTTAYNQHAVRAFRVDAIDYLLKPLKFGALISALDKARTHLRLRAADRNVDELKDMLNALQGGGAAVDQPRYDTEFWVFSGSKFERVHVDSIDWVQAERDYVYLHSRGQSWLMKETMVGIEARLDPNIFVRVRRSALVRKERIASIQRLRRDKLIIHLVGGTEIPVGTTYVKQVRGLLGPAT
jgi:DNA-binding LytR/AlgR family response regulator